MKDFEYLPHFCVGEITIYSLTLVNSTELRFRGLAEDGQCQLNAVTQSPEEAIQLELELQSKSRAALRCAIGFLRLDLRVHFLVSSFWERWRKQRFFQLVRFLSRISIHVVSILRNAW